MPGKLALVKTDDPNFTRFQNQLGTALFPLLNNPVNYGVLLTDVDLSSSAVTIVNHTLNRKLQGWFLVRKRADSRVWDTQDSNTNTSNSLYLNCSADVTVDIWVF